MVSQADACDGGDRSWAYLRFESRGMTRFPESRRRRPAAIRPDPNRSRPGPGGPPRWSPASVEVPAVSPTVAKSLNQAGSSSPADWTCTAGLPRSRQRAASSRVLFELRPPDDHDGVDAIQQPLERALMLLGRQADRVDELDLGVRVPRGDRRPDARHAILGHRRLADDPQPPMRIDRRRPRPTRSRENHPGRRRSPRPRRGPSGRSPGRDSPRPGASGPPDAPARPAGTSCR